MALTSPDRAPLDAAWQRAEERRAFWDAKRATLTQQYPDEFVAIFNGDVVAHDPDLLSLVQHLRASGHDPRDVWIEFLATERHKFLL